MHTVAACLLEAWVTGPGRASLPMPMPQAPSFPAQACAPGSASAEQAVDSASRLVGAAALQELISLSPTAPGPTLTQHGPLEVLRLGSSPGPAERSVQLLESC